MPTLKKPRGSSDLTKEVTDLKWAIIHSVDSCKRLFQTRRLLSLAFLKGAVSALGAMVAVVIVIPLIIWALKIVSWPPIINNIVSIVIDQVEKSNPPLPRAAVDQ